MQNGSTLCERIDSALTTQKISQVQNPLENGEDQIQTFLYAIIHDLRSPLISVEGYARRLKKELGINISKDALTYLHYIQESTSHMNDLLDDLMDLAQLGNVDNTASILNTQSLISEVLNEMRQSPNGGAIYFYVQSDLPQIFCNKKRAYQVFTNVIGNAVKFIGNAKSPRIRIGFTGNEFFVEDNGPGIAPEHHQKIFEIFARFNAEGIEGTGIGLPTTRKILESMGGSIRVESIPGQGAAFYLKLPLPNKQNDLHQPFEGQRELILKNAPATCQK